MSIEPIRTKIEPTLIKKAQFSIEDLFKLFKENNNSIIYIHKNLLSYLIKLNSFKGMFPSGQYENYSFTGNNFFVLSSKKEDWHLVELDSTNTNLYNYSGNINIEDILFLKLEE